MTTASENVGVVPTKLTRTQKLAIAAGVDVSKSPLPEFRVGDTVRVHARIIEGTKERIQVFEGAVIKRHGKVGPRATFTVRKISFNIGVERTFLVNSPRIDKLDIVTKGVVRRARLFYLRPLRGKAARIRGRYTSAPSDNSANEQASSTVE